MKVYGYEIKGNAEILEDIKEVQEIKNMRINWESFKTGDKYFSGSGKAYKVTINHEEKIAELTPA